MSSAALTPTSYVVLGLLEVSGPATSYALKQRVSATVGHFWSFPHTQLYTEPPRLVQAGLLTEEREQGGRRRRLYALTGEGRDALRAWLAETRTADLEIRDQGLLKLFFAEGADADDLVALAEAQRRRHEQKLATYADLQAALGPSDRRSPRGATLRLGIAVEQAYVDFWNGLVHDPPSSSG